MTINASDGLHKIKQQRTRTQSAGNSLNRQQTGNTASSSYGHIASVSNSVDGSSDFSNDSFCSAVIMTTTDASTMSEPSTSATSATTASSSASCPTSLSSVNSQAHLDNGIPPSLSSAYSLARASGHDLESSVANHISHQMLAGQHASEHVDLLASPQRPPLPPGCAPPRHRGLRQSPSSSRKKPSRKNKNAAMEQSLAASSSPSPLKQRLDAIVHKRLEADHHERWASRQPLIEQPPPSFVLTFSGAGGGSRDGEQPAIVPPWSTWLPPSVHERHRAQYGTELSQVPNTTLPMSMLEHLGIRPMGQSSVEGRPTDDDDDDFDGAALSRQLDEEFAARMMETRPSDEPDAQAMAGEHNNEPCVRQTSTTQELAQSSTERPLNSSPARVCECLPSSQGESRPPSASGSTPTRKKTNNSKSKRFKKKTRKTKAEEATMRAQQHGHQAGDAVTNSQVDDVDGDGETQAAQGGGGDLLTSGNTDPPSSSPDACSDAVTDAGDSRRSEHVISAAPRTEIPHDRQERQPVRISIKLPPAPAVSSALNRQPGSPTRKSNKSRRDKPPTASTASSRPSDKRAPAPGPSSAQQQSEGTKNHAAPSVRRPPSPVANDASPGQAPASEASGGHTGRSSSSLSKSQRMRQRHKAARERLSASLHTRHVAEIVSAAERGELVVNAPHKPQHSQDQPATLGNFEQHQQHAFSSPSKSTVKGSSAQAQVHKPTNDSLESLEEGRLSKADTEESFRSAHSGPLSSSTEYTTALPAHSPKDSRSPSMERSLSESFVVVGEDGDDTVRQNVTSATETTRQCNRAGASPRSKSDTTADSSPSPPSSSSSAQRCRPGLHAGCSHETTPSGAPVQAPSDGQSDRGGDVPVGCREKWEESLLRTESWRRETEHAKRALNAGHLTPSESSIWWSSPDCSSTNSFTDDKVRAAWDEPYDASPDPIIVEGIEAGLPRRVVNALPQIFGVRRWPMKLFGKRRSRSHASTAKLDLSKPSQLAVFAREVDALPSFEHEHLRFSRARELRLACLRYVDLELFVEQGRCGAKVAKSPTGYRTWQVHSILIPGTWTPHKVFSRAHFEIDSQPRPQQPSRRIVSTTSRVEGSTKAAAEAAVVFSAAPKSTIQSSAPYRARPEETQAVVHEATRIEPSKSALSPYARLPATYTAFLPLRDCSSSLHSEEPSSDMTECEDLYNGLPNLLPDRQWMDSLRSLDGDEKDAIEMHFERGKDLWEKSSCFWGIRSRQSTTSGSITSETGAPLGDAFDRRAGAEGGINRSASHDQLAHTIATIPVNELPASMLAPVVSTTLPPEVTSTATPMQYYRFRRQANLQPSTTSASVEGLDMRDLVDAVQVHLRDGGVAGSVASADACQDHAAHAASGGHPRGPASVSIRSTPSPSPSTTGSCRDGEDSYRVSRAIQVTAQQASPGRLQRERDALEVVQREYESRQRQAQQAQAAIFAAGQMVWFGQQPRSPGPRPSHRHLDERAPEVAARGTEREHRGRGGSPRERGYGSPRTGVSPSTPSYATAQQQYFDGRRMLGRMAVPMLPVAFAPYGMVPGLAVPQAYAQAVERGTDGGDARRMFGTRATGASDNLGRPRHLRIETPARVEFFPHAVESMGRDGAGDDDEEDEDGRREQSESPRSGYSFVAPRTQEPLVVDGCVSRDAYFNGHIEYRAGTIDTEGGSWVRGGQTAGNGFQGGELYQHSRGDGGSGMMRREESESSRRGGHGRGHRGEDAIGEARSVSVDDEYQPQRRRQQYVQYAPRYHPALQPQGSLRSPGMRTDMTLR